MASVNPTYHSAKKRGDTSGATSALTKYLTPLLGFDSDFM
jgi:hypothetical protein